MRRIFFGGSACLLLLFLALGKSGFNIGGRKISKSRIQGKLTEAYFNGERPQFDFESDGDKYHAKTTFSGQLIEYGEKLLKRYKTPFSTYAIIDNNNGEVIAAGGVDKITNRITKNLAFSTTHPAASLAKIITASALFEFSTVHPGTIFKYNGRGTTLYKYQLKDKKSRWTRKIPFERAFNYSNNVVFGKAAINEIKSGNLLKMANQFGFNSDITSDILLPNSKFDYPSSQYQLAEYASGFNKKTTISAVHAAYLSYLVVNDGKAGPLRTIKEIKDVDDPEKDLSGLLKGDVSIKVNEDTIKQVSRLMKSTVKKGTARGSFAYMKKNLHKKLEIGAKTGSITGGFPFGKHEWITVFAKPKNSAKGDKGISVAVLNINKEKWYVRSGYIAKKLIEYYFNHYRQEKWTKITQK